MIPRCGPRHDVNKAAVFHRMTEPLNHDDATVPAVIVGGVRVSMYVDDDGAFHVRIYTDEEELSPLLGRTPGDGVMMRVVINDTTIYEES